MRLILILIILLFFARCNNNQNQITKEKPCEFKLDSSQILLTNYIDFNNRPLASGASSFLVKVNRDTLLCTVKHLLGEAMGIEPSVPKDSVNDLLYMWLAYPRVSNYSNDTLAANVLINNTSEDRDIITFSLKYPTKNIKVLQPFLGELNTNEILYIIGCEYKDTLCAQKIYPCQFIDYENSDIKLKSKKSFELAGFSGAPVVNCKGEVIGLIWGGLDSNLYATPIKAIQNLKH